MERLIILLIIFTLAFLFFIYKLIKQHKTPIITTRASIISIKATSSSLSPAAIYYAIFRSEKNEDIRVAINYKMYKKFRVSSELGGMLISDNA